MKLLYSFIGLILLNSSLFSATSLSECGYSGLVYSFTNIESTKNDSAHINIFTPAYVNCDISYGGVPSASIATLSGKCVLRGQPNVIDSDCSDNELQVINKVYTAVSSCPEGQFPNAEGICEIPSCSPLSDITVSLSESQCINGAVYQNDYIKSGILSYQQCDNTCYVLESQMKTCDDALTEFKSSCDTDLNIGKFNCTSVSFDDDTIADLNKSCIPKNQAPISSPCDKRVQEMKITCSNSNQDVSGTCNDNGIVITNDTLKCVDKVPDCPSVWHEHLSADGTACECDDGYVFTTLGDCRLPFPWENDSNLTDEQQSQKTNADNTTHNAKNQDDTTKKTNDKLDKLQNTQDNTNNALSGIRNDLNTTNNLLNAINDKLDSNNTTASSYLSPNMDSHNQIMSAFDTVTTSMDNIKSDYDSLLSKVQQGFSASPVSNGITPSFTAQVFGRTITLDMCASFSAFYPIGYFVFSIIFIIIGVRIFLYAFMMGV